MFKFLKRINELEKKVLALEKYNKDEKESNCAHVWDYAKFKQVLCLGIPVPDCYIIKCKKCGKEKQIYNENISVNINQQYTDESISFLRAKGYKVTKGKTNEKSA
jgi:hypothetical protein